MKTTSASVASPVPTQIAAVNFHGHTLTVITGSSGEHLVAMKPICEAIGIGWQSQYNRIKRHPVLSQGVVIMNTPSAGGEQETSCLPLDMLNGWLFGVDAARVRPEIRDTLIQYQRECFAVLAAYWQRGDSSVNLQKPKALPNGLSLDQQTAIKTLVKARIEALPQNKQAKAAITCWSALKSRFGCSYKDINPDQFTDAVSLVARVVLEGELLERQPQESQPQKPALEIDFPVSGWIKDNPWFKNHQVGQGQGRFLVTADMLCGMDSRSATLKLIASLEEAGYDVSACRMEVRALRQHLEISRSYIRTVQTGCHNTLLSSIHYKVE